MSSPFHRYLFDHPNNIWLHYKLCHRSTCQGSQCSLRDSSWRRCGKFLVCIIKMTTVALLSFCRLLWIKENTFITIATLPLFWLAVKFGLSLLWKIGGFRENVAKDISGYGSWRKLCSEWFIICTPLQIFGWWMHLHSYNEGQCCTMRSLCTYVTLKDTSVSCCKSASLPIGQVQRVRGFICDQQIAHVVCLSKQSAMQGRSDKLWVVQLTWRLA